MKFTHDSNHFEALDCPGYSEVFTVSFDFDPDGVPAFEIVREQDGKVFSLNDFPLKERMAITERVLDMNRAYCRVNADLIERGRLQNKAMQESKGE